MKIVVAAAAALLIAAPVSAQEPSAAEPPAVAPPSPAPPTGPAPAATRRDPFRPFNLSMRPDRPQPPKTPLEKYHLGELTLVAVIYDTANPKAMVEDGSGLGYTVSVGTPIGNANGVVKAIEPDRIVVEEEFVDFYNEKKKTDTVLRLKPEGEKRP